MKKGTLLLSLVAMMFLAGIASAQNGRLYIATDVGVYVSLVQTGEMPTIDLVAGEPIRLRAGAHGTGKTMAASLIANINTTQVPCNAGGGAGTNLQNFTLVKLRQNYQLHTRSDWKGSCQVLTVRLGDGTEHRGKIRFR